MTDAAATIFNAGVKIASIFPSKLLRTCKFELIDYTNNFKPHYNSWESKKFRAQIIGDPNHRSDPDPTEAEPCYKQVITFSNQELPSNVKVGICWKLENEGFIHVFIKVPIRGKNKCKMLFSKSQLFDSNNSSVSWKKFWKSSDCQIIEESTIEMPITHGTDTFAFSLSGDIKNPVLKIKVYKSAMPPSLLRTVQVTLRDKGVSRLKQPLYKLEPNIPLGCINNQNDDKDSVFEFKFKTKEAIILYHLTRNVYAIILLKIKIPWLYNDSTNARAQMKFYSDNKLNLSIRNGNPFENLKFNELWDENRETVEIDTVSKHFKHDSEICKICKINLCYSNDQSGVQLNIELEYNFTFREQLTCRCFLYNLSVTHLLCYNKIDNKVGFMSDKDIQQDLSTIWCFTHDQKNNKIIITNEDKKKYLTAGVDMSLDSEFSFTGSYLYLIPDESNSNKEIYFDLHYDNSQNGSWTIILSTRQKNWYIIPISRSDFLIEPIITEDPNPILQDNGFYKIVALRPKKRDLKAKCITCDNENKIIIASIAKDFADFSPQTWILNILEYNNGKYKITLKQKENKYLCMKTDPKELQFHTCIDQTTTFFVQYDKSMFCRIYSESDNLKNYLTTEKVISFSQELNEPTEQSRGTEWLLLQIHQNYYSEVADRDGLVWPIKIM